MLSISRSARYGRCAYRMMLMCPLRNKSFHQNPQTLTFCMTLLCGAIVFSNLS